jgi:hypothetical protein
MHCQIVLVGRGAEPHIRAAGSRHTDWHRAVSATPAQVAVTGALVAVSPATAVVQLSQAHQQAWIPAQVNIVRTLVQACIHTVVVITYNIRQCLQCDEPLEEKFCLVQWCIDVGNDIGILLPTKGNR